MRAPRVPAIDERRAAEFLAELQERARLWMPEWGVDDDPRDFGRALLEIAARFNSEVAERLDRAGEKMRRGFLDWLAIDRQAARPARAPVVFRLVETATAAVNAPSAVRLQANAAGAPVIFETDDAIRLHPGRLSAIVAVDADRDAFYLPPPDIFDLGPPEPRPTQWLPKTAAPAGSRRLQLDPEAGLDAGMVIEVQGALYRVETVDKDLVGIVPPLAADLAKGTFITRVSTFDPFRSRTIAGARGEAEDNGDQEHILYIGDDELLNLESAVDIEIVGVTSMPKGARWEYWGRKVGDDAARAEGSEPEPAAEDELGWLPLNPESGPNSVRLKKENQGALEPLEILGRTSRWIRAVVKSLDGASTNFEARSLQLRVQSSGRSVERSGVTCPPEAGARKGPVVEAMTNSTPLVVDKLFHPLGREPRLSDAFYLGCSEAFSKTGAEVGVCLEIASSTCESFAAIPIEGGDQYILAGVGKNGALQLVDFHPSDPATTLKFRDGPRWPSPTPTGGAGASPAVTERLNPDCRPVMWVEGNGSTVSIAVAAGNQIWRWLENTGEARTSEWRRHGETPEDSRIVDLVSGADEKELLAALADGALYIHAPPKGNEPSGTWEERTPENLRQTGIASITPVVDAEGNRLDRIIAVSRKGGLHLLKPGEKPTDRWLEKELQPDGALDATIAPPAQAEAQAVAAGESSGVDPKRPIHPAARIIQNMLTIVAVGSSRTSLVALRGDTEGGSLQRARVDLEGDAVIGDALTLIEEGGGPRVFATVSRDSESYLVASWAPMFPKIDNPNKSNSVRKTNLPITAGGGAGTPLVVADRVVVPGPREDAYLAPLYTPVLFKKVIGEGVVFPPTAPEPRNDKILSALFVQQADGGRHQIRRDWRLKEPLDSADGSRLYPIPAEIKSRAAADPKLIAYFGTGKKGEIRSKSTFAVKRDPAPGLEVGAIARIRVKNGSPIFGEVKNIKEDEEPTGGGGAGATRAVWIIEIKDEALPEIPDGESKELNYWAPTADFGSDPPTVAPMIRLEEAGDDLLKIAGSLRDPVLEFAVESSPQIPEPSKQSLRPFGVDPATNFAAAFVLAERWTVSPSLEEATPFRARSVLGEGWRRYLGPTATNPELSWEYWNGRGWWSLKVADGAARLANTGTVSFTVPADIAESNWSGKTNYWIRARLIGGDYGRETVSVITNNTKDGSIQTVDRSVEGIRAPQISGVHVSYGMRGARRPAWVLTRDGGTTRDQSDANRSKDAIIEAFVPIGAMLGRFDRGGPETALARPSPEGGRSLFLGLTASPSEGPVRILLLIDNERLDDGGFASLEVEALVADRFVKVVAQDETRVLGETGVLALYFSLAPTLRELFGMTLNWLRIRPRSSSETWTPTLRGAYLNGAWASARETLTRERLGSSDGSPSLSVQLARPPVLRDSLELRVREPLGEEERRRLVGLGPDTVKSNVEGLPGDWVLWKQVVDPGDEPAGARVYAMDEATGEIRFGDGEHGRIPPIGVDGIVAFRYSRAEPGVDASEGVPGNAVEARTPLDLVSPIQSVDVVVVADQAAGGQPPESDDRVLRFGHARLRHRGRAVTGRDLEDLILQSSPDFVQARAIEKPGGVRVVVVRRGANPEPSVAQIRELTRLARSVGPAALTAPGALEIQGPTIRRLRIRASLLIENLDFAGSLTTQVVARLLAFFDPETGGPERAGWPPGANVSDNEVAPAIFDVPHLLSIKSLTLEEIGPEGGSAWPKSLNPDEIPSLTADFINLDILVPQAIP